MDSGCILRKADYLGFEAYLLQNEHMQICVVPELGGKITSIKHITTGREWLWQNPHLPAKPVEYDASFVERYDTGGLDECFPAVAAGSYPDVPWQGVMIPDHGELWCQPWQVSLVESTSDQINMVLTCYGVRFPYRFERKLRLSALSPTLKLDYKVTNLTGFDFPFVWSIHPILNIETGMRIHLPEAVEQVRIDGDLHRFWGDRGDLIAWQTAKRVGEQSITLTQVQARDFGQAYKLYTQPLLGDEKVETAVSIPIGNHAFTFRFHPQEITHVGLWLNYGGWSGIGSHPYFNLGLEPCIGGTDSLSQAKEMAEYGLLPAKQTRQWLLELSIT